MTTKDLVIVIIANDHNQNPPCSPAMPHGDERLGLLRQPHSVSLLKPYSADTQAAAPPETLAAQVAQQ